MPVAKKPLTKPATSIGKTGLKFGTSAVAPARQPSPPEEPRRIFRLFECLMHVEIAQASINRVGVIPAERQQEIKDLLLVCKSDIAKLQKIYHDLWASMK
jgi:hypothetical protein